MVSDEIKSLVSTVRNRRQKMVDDQDGKCQQTSNSIRLFPRYFSDKTKQIGEDIIRLNSRHTSPWLKVSRTSTFSLMDRSRASHVHQTWVSLCMWIFEFFLIRISLGSMMTSSSCVNGDEQMRGRRCNTTPATFPRRPQSFGTTAVSI